MPKKGPKGESAPPRSRPAPSASSARAADALGAGFFGAQRDSAAAAVLTHGFGALALGATGGPDMPPQVAVALKGLAKRSDTTRVKAMEDLVALTCAPDADASNLDALVAVWPAQFNRLALELDRSLRIGSCRILGAVARHAKRDFAPALRSVIGVWFAAMHDPAADVSAAAESAFNAAFPDRRARVLAHGQAAILDWIAQMVLEATPESLSDPRFVADRDREAKFARVVACALQSASSLLRELPDDEIVIARLLDLWRDPRFSRVLDRSAAHPARAAAFRLIGCLGPHMAKASDCSNGAFKQLMDAAVREESSTVISAVWDCLVALARARCPLWATPEAAEREFPSVVVRLVKNGPQVAQVALLPFVASVDSALVRLDQQASATAFLDALWTTVVSDSPHCGATFVAATECAVFLVQRASDSAAALELLQDFLWTRIVLPLVLHNSVFEPQPRLDPKSVAKALADALQHNFQAERRSAWVAEQLQRLVVEWYAGQLAAGTVSHEWGLALALQVLAGTVGLDDETRAVEQLARHSVATLQNPKISPEASEEIARNLYDIVETHARVVPTQEFWAEIAQNLVQLCERKPSTGMARLAARWWAASPDRSLSDWTALVSAMRNASGLSEALRIRLFGDALKQTVVHFSSDNHGNDAGLNAADAVQLAEWLWSLAESEPSPALTYVTEAPSKLAPAVARQTLATRIWTLGSRELVAQLVEKVRSGAQLRELVPEPQLSERLVELWKHQPSRHGAGSVPQSDALLVSRTLSLLECNGPGAAAFLDAAAHAWAAAVALAETEPPQSAWLAPAAVQLLSRSSLPMSARQTFAQQTVGSSVLWHDALLVASRDSNPLQLGRLLETLMALQAAAPNAVAALMPRDALVFVLATRLLGPSLPPGVLDQHDDARLEQLARLMASKLVLDGTASVQNLGNLAVPGLVVLSNASVEPAVAVFDSSGRSKSLVYSILDIVAAALVTELPGKKPALLDSLYEGMRRFAAAKQLGHAAVAAHVWRQLLDENCAKAWSETVPWVLAPLLREMTIPAAARGGAQPIAELTLALATLSTPLTRSHPFHAPSDSASRLWPLAIARTALDHANGDQWWQLVGELAESVADPGAALDDVLATDISVTAPLGQLHALATLLWRTTREARLVGTSVLEAPFRQLVAGLPGSQPLSQCILLLAPFANPTDALAHVSHLVAVLCNAADAIEGQAAAYAVLSRAVKAEVDAWSVELGVREAAASSVLASENAPAVLQVPQALAAVLDGAAARTRSGDSLVGVYLLWLLVWDALDAASDAAREALVAVAGWDKPSVRDQALVPYFDSLANELSVGGLGDSGDAELHVDRFVVDVFCPEGICAYDAMPVRLLAAHSLYRVLRVVPGVYRDHFAAKTDRQSSLAIEKFVERYYSRRLLEQEISTLQTGFQAARADPDARSGLHGIDMSRIALRINRSGLQVTLEYRVEETAIDMVVRLPQSYPLRIPEAHAPHGSHAGVDAKKWRSWLLHFQAVVSQGRRSLFDSAVVWFRNIDGWFGGVDDCAICYSIICLVDRSLPNKQCSTCQHRFHGHCIYKWFRNSNQASCPLCRNLF